MDTINIVMTGGTSGFGVVSAERLVENRKVRLFAGYRNRDVPGATNIQLELGSLRSVRSFAEEVIRQTGTEKINVLIFNAGTNYPTVDERTEDGIESNFGVNHVAHYYLLRMLMPHLSENARIIITTSGTIDPTKKTLGSPPKHANAFWLAFPELDATLDEDEKVNGQRAYSSSKLCNLMTAMQINRLPDAGKLRWESIAYDPGLTPGTGLIRHMDETMKTLSMQLSDSDVRKEKFPLSNSIEDAGVALADIALGRTTPPGGKYVALRGGNITFIEPPGLARDENLVKKVWEDTEALLKDRMNFEVS